MWRRRKTGIGEGKRVGDRWQLRAQMSMWSENRHKGMGNDGGGKDGVFLGTCQVTHFFSLGKKKKKTRGDHFKLRFRKNFQALLEEQVREELMRENPTGKG